MRAMLLTRHRQMHGLSVGRFAKLAKVACSTLWRLEHGQAVPQAATRARIVAATRGEVSEQELIMQGSGLAGPTAPDDAEEAA